MSHNNIISITKANRREADNRTITQEEDLLIKMEVKVVPKDVSLEMVEVVVKHNKWDCNIYKTNKLRR